MTTILVMLGIILWEVCGWYGYKLARTAIRARESVDWTRGDRHLYGIGSILFGPIAIISSLVVFGQESKKSKEPVDW